MTATAGLGFADNLATHGDRVAAITPDGHVTYAALDALVTATAERLGPVRRLVLLAARNDLDSLACYLGALRGGHPVLLAAPNQVADLTAVHDPDVVITEGWAERRAGTRHDLHPELALLLSTSGSTGSPKLVRLSADGLRANAEAIAEYLDIRPTDRAITSLPMHYCYGLSVVNSNLSRGAGLVLTDRSVLDPEFWDAVREHGVTSLHGVPHTFDLLDGLGFERMHLPSLRYVTQAGGRLAPDRVARLASHDWRFFVMYGQTEATARMAYLPPELAREHPSAIGVPIPGGSFDLVDGELVYRGPNVMLGYAESPADLALGRTTHQLRTGDLGRRTPEGLYEVVGRRSRFLKLFGLRVDLDRVERVLADAGVRAVCAGDDTRLVVAVTSAACRAEALVRERFGLPADCVRVVRVDRIPLLANGKPDYRAVARLDRGVTAGSVRELFAAVLGERDVPDDATFVGLGGDSLTYVRMSVELGRLLDRLPDDWPTTPVAELERRRGRPARVPTVETGIVLRAPAIVLVVGSHIRFFDVTGGAHLLLVIAGWNFARFLLPAAPARIVRSAALIAVPTSAWPAYRVASTDDVTWVNVALVNNFVRTGAVGYWFAEVVVPAGLALLPALARVPLPRPALAVVSLIASASLYIYLTHYAVFPPLLDHFPPGVVVVLSLAAGVLAWWVSTFVRRPWAALRRVSG